MSNTAKLTACITVAAASVLLSANGSAVRAQNPSTGAVEASALWFQFTGTTAGQPSPIEFLGGKQFILTVRLDPTKLDSNISDPLEAVYLGAVTAGRLEIVLDSTSALFWTITSAPERNRVVVLDAPHGQPDFYEIAASTTGPLGGGGWFEVLLTDLQGDALNSRTFPTSLADFSGFDQRSLSFFGRSGFGIIDAYQVVAGLDLTDTDGDGIPDESDNCPNVPNFDQLDSDVDSVGDVCDPFPTDHDNDKAQCHVDLTKCSADLSTATNERTACLTSLADTRTSLTACAADLSATMKALADLSADADRDGLPDRFDKCAATAPGAAIDSLGCSVDQFCGAILVDTANGKNICRAADWRNDDPLGTSQSDCRVVPRKDSPGYMCVAAPR